MEEHVHHATGPGMMELIQLANLVVVILLGYFGARKGIMAAVEARAQNIAKKLTSSKQDLEKAQAELASAQSELDKIEDFKKQIFSQVRDEGEKLASQILLEAKTVAARIVSDAQVAAEDETRVATRRLRAKVIEEALARSQTMLTEQMKSAGGEKVHEKMVDRFVEDVRGAVPSTNGKHKHGTA